MDAAANQTAPAPIKTNRWRRCVLVLTLTIVIVWLGVSALATWYLAKRPFPIAPEPTPQVPWGPIESARLTTPDGEKIGAWLIRRPTSNTVVLLLHGFTSRRSTWLQMMHDLADRNVSVMAISLRAHGDSTGTLSDVGYSARFDVEEAVTFLKREFPQQRIVVVGSSMGAAAAIFACKDLRDSVSAYFFEAPYRDLRSAVWNRVNTYLFPPFSWAAYAGLQLWSPIFLHTNVDSIRPIDHIGDIPPSIPVTILVSQDDHSATLTESKDLAAKLAGHVRLVTVHGGHHGMLAGEMHDLYLNEIMYLVDQTNN